MHRFQAFVEIFKVVAVVFISAVIIRYFIFQPFVVEGSSMEPDFHSGEYLLIEKIGYRLKEPKRGDVIVFQYPNNPSVNYIKRIIALPGEKVSINNGRVYINDSTLAEPYLSSEEKTYVRGDLNISYSTTLSDEQYFVMGDNREHSSDSREWGPLHRRYIIGRSALVLYPQQNFRTIPSPHY